MADTPLHGKTDLIVPEILVDGSEIPGTYEVVEIEVDKELNRISTARVHIRDGNPSEETFAGSESGDFDPGKEIKINIGYHDEQRETIFEGLIVGHGIKIRGADTSELVLKCVDKAAKMTINRHNKYFLEVKDSDVISQLLGDHGVAGTVDSTSVTHKELIQYQSTDWDFVLSRAEMNGLVVITNDGTTDVVAPQTSGSGEVSLTYGKDIINSQLEMDARNQVNGVSTFAWNMSTNSMDNSTASEPSTNDQGDITGSTLAEILSSDPVEFHSTGPLPTDDLQAWADARLLKSRLARIRGTITFQGSALVKPNTLIEITGLGSKFNGKAYVSSVHHHIMAGKWETEAGVGLSEEHFSESRPKIELPSAAGLLPGIKGLYAATVQQIEEDPDGESRILVDIPVIQESGDGVWARMAHLYASSNIGSFFLPEVGDEVILGFLNQDPRYPVILGMLYSQSHEPPYTADADNTIKAIVTRSEMKLEFNDVDIICTVETPNGNKLVFSDDEGSITMEDENGNKMVMDSSGISIETPGDFNLDATGAINITSSDAINATATSDMKLEGMNVTNKASIAFKAEGVQAEVKGSGQTTIKGGVVMIN